MPFTDLDLASNVVSGTKQLFFRFYREKATEGVQVDGWGRWEAKKMDAVFEVFLVAAKCCNIQV